jgi:hypothetical protein
MLLPLHLLRLLGLLLSSLWKREHLGKIAMKEMPCVIRS